jgi:type VI secretion system secreted protein VgrG
VAQQVNTHIEIEGGHEIKRHLGLVIEQDLFSHHQFELKVPFDELEDKGEHFFNKAHTDVMGKKITFSFSPRLGKKGNKEPFEFKFQGIVTEIRLQSLSDMNSAFILKGYSPTIIMEDAVQRRFFKDKSTKDVVNQVIEAYPQNVLKRKIKPENNGMQYFVQYDESNYMFLSRVAERLGEWFYYNGTEVIFGKNDTNTVEFTVDGIQQFDIAMVLHPIHFKMERYSASDDEMLKTDSASQTITGLNTLGKFTMDESEKLFAQPSITHPQIFVPTLSDLKNVAKADKAARISKLIEFKGSGEKPDVSIGSVLDVKGHRMTSTGKSYEESFGKYRVLHIRHEVTSSGNYSNQFNAIPESAQNPPSNPNVRQPIGKPELAEVIDNNDSDAKLGRVKVKFMWGQAKDSEQESVWLRVVKPYIGEGKGFNFVPELKSQVYVDYGNSNPETPIVIGGVYPKAKHGEKYTHDNNATKAIATRSGNIILYDDTDGKNTIRIEHLEKSETYIHFKFDDKEMLIHAEGGKIKIKTSDLTIDADNITINASQKLKIEAGEISLKSKTGDIKIESTVNVDIKATAELKAEGTVSAKIKGAMTTVEADAMLELKSSAILKATGTPIMLN